MVGSFAGTSAATNHYGKRFDYPPDYAILIENTKQTGCDSMEMIWEYPLPTNERCSDYEYESPILENGSYVYFVSDSTPGKKLHIIDKDSGMGTVVPMEQSFGIIPSQYFFFSYNGKAVIYTGDLHFVQGRLIVKTLALSGKGKINSHLLSGKYLFVSCGSGMYGSLCCIDLDALSIAWEIDISNSKRYRAGELSFFDNTISCYGRDQLLLVQPDSGEIARTIKIPEFKNCSARSGWTMIPS